MYESRVKYAREREKRTLGDTRQCGTRFVAVGRVWDDQKVISGGGGGI